MWMSHLRESVHRSTESKCHNTSVVGYDGHRKAGIPDDQLPLSMAKAISTAAQLRLGYQVSGSKQISARLLYGS